MNKRLFQSMIYLAIGFLIGCYVLKFFLPEQFVLFVQNKRLVDIGYYIDTHPLAFYSFGILTSFTTYWLFCCAVCKKLYLSKKECFIVLIAVVGSIFITLIDVQLSTHYSVFSMIFLAYLFKAEFKETLIIFGIHGFAQAISLSIRDLTTYMMNFDSLSFLVLTFECYLWLILFYLKNNIRKEK